MNTLDELRSGTVAGARRISLSCGLEELPPEIYALADTLEILDVSGNALSSLPDDLPRLHKLRIVFASNNRFTRLPPVLGQCAQLEMIGFRANQIAQVPADSLPAKLRWLVLTENQLCDLPASLGQCRQLQKLMLAGNRLETLPQEMSACTRLELLRIAANAFTVLPDWLLALPRLSWLAFAGNPLAEKAAAEATAQAGTSTNLIDWRELLLQDKLGEGASGIIYQAVWQQDGERPGKPVAVKMFKGSMTSDGLPQSEMAACMSAGGHPSLITVHGELTGHPQGASGLVMDLIDPRFRGLADPPSLASCTRDIYENGAHLSPQAALRVALGMASAARQLHARGILHGDLYGHNILCSDEGEALLGDYGAASFFDAGDEPLASALQRIEVRAFACLLEELIELCSRPAVERDDLLATEEQPRDQPAALALLAAMTDLQKRCASQDTEARPVFEEIEHILSALQS